MPTKSVYKTIPGNDFHFSCDECDGEYLDTRVNMNGIFLCYITFSDVENFFNDFQTLLTKYRI